MLQMLQCFKKSLQGRCKCCKDSKDVASFAELANCCRTFKCCTICGAFMLQMLQRPLKRCKYYRDLESIANVAELPKCCRCCGIFKMLQMLRCFQNVAGVAVLSRCLQILRCFQNVANIAETLKMLQMFQCFRNVANVTVF